MPFNLDFNQSLKNVSRLILLILAIVVFSVTYWLAEDYLSPEQGEVAQVDPGCNLRATDCTSIFASGQTVNFEITPKNFRISEAMTLKVSIKGAVVDRVQVDIAGINMSMGFNRPELKKMNNQQFTGVTTLPICSQSEMQWEARVLVHTGKGLLIAPYRFTTSH